MSVRSTSGSSCTTYGTRVQLYTYSTFKVTSVRRYFRTYFVPLYVYVYVRVRVRVRVVRVRCTFEDIFSGSEQVQYTYCTTYVYRLYTYTYSFFLLYVRVQCTRVHVHVVVRPRTKPSGRKRKSAVLKFSRSTLGLHVYTERKNLGWDGTRFLNLYALAAHFFCFFQRVQRVPSSKRCKTAFFSLKVKPRPSQRHFR